MLVTHGAGWIKKSLQHPPTAMFQASMSSSLRLAFACQQFGKAKETTAKPCIFFCFWKDMI
jgi:hypothetical protein